MSQPVAHNIFDFIVIFKLRASRELFQGTKQVLKRQGLGYKGDEGAVPSQRISSKSLQCHPLSPFC